MLLGVGRKSWFERLTVAAQKVRVMREIRSAAKLGEKECPIYYSLAEEVGTFLSKRGFYFSAEECVISWDMEAVNNSEREKIFSASNMYCLAMANSEWDFFAEYKHCKKEILNFVIFYKCSREKLYSKFAYSTRYYMKDTSFAGFLLKCLRAEGYAACLSKDMQSIHISWDAPDMAGVEEDYISGWNKIPRWSMVTNAFMMKNLTDVKRKKSDHKTWLQIYCKVFRAACYGDSEVQINNLMPSISMAKCLAAKFDVTIYPSEGEVFPSFKLDWSNPSGKVTLSEPQQSPVLIYESKANEDDFENASANVSDLHKQIRTHYWLAPEAWA